MTNQTQVSAEPVGEAMNEADLEIIRHSLGLTSGRTVPYRNYFAATPMHSDMPKIERLMAAGLMFKGRTAPSAHGDMTFYHVTDAGCSLVGTTREAAER